MRRQQQVISNFDDELRDGLYNENMDFILTTFINDYPNQNIVIIKSTVYDMIFGNEFGGRFFPNSKSGSDNINHQFETISKKMKTTTDVILVPILVKVRPNGLLNHWILRLY